MFLSGLCELRHVRDDSPISLIHGMQISNLDTNLGFGGLHSTIWFVGLTDGVLLLYTSSFHTPDELISSVSINAALFDVRPSRRGLLELNSFPFIKSKAIVVNVWRNHNFETFIPFITPYTSYVGVDVVWNVGAYDDSLTFINHKPSDIELLWLDVNEQILNMSFGSWSEWLLTRIDTLRTITNAPIVVVTRFPSDYQCEIFQKTIAKMPAVYFGSLRDFISEDEFLSSDDPKALLSASRLRQSVHTSVARYIGTTVIMGCLPQVVKVIAVDLDNTLYSGILGEDGPAGLEVMASHFALQEVLVSAVGRGIVLAIISKNDIRDVEELFAQRQDFPLRMEHVTYVKASWKPKHEAILELATQANVGLDSILFIDDNLGEVLDVVAALPTVRPIFASNSENWVARAVDFYPGIRRYMFLDSDLVRKSDLVANVERNVLLERLGDVSRYQLDLKMALSFFVDSSCHLNRVTDLANKTNQFNLALTRMSAATIKEFVDDDHCSVVVWSLSDRLANSGLIGFIAARKSGSTVFIDEICISCRALGRGLEDLMVGQAILSVPCINDIRQVTFRYARGPRNVPALEWLSKISSQSIEEGNDEITVPIETVFSLTTNCFVDISIVRGG